MESWRGNIFFSITFWKSCTVPKLGAVQQFCALLSHHGCDMYADGHITEGTLMIFKVAHLCFKKLRPCNERSASVYNHLMCCEQFTVGRGSLKMVSVDTETRRIVIFIYDLAQTVWLISVG